MVPRISSADLVQQKGRVGVVRLNEGLDIGLELGCGAMDPAPELALGEQGEEALELIDPGRAGGREVGVPARTLGESVTHRLRLVRGVVVHHQVDIEVSGHGGLDLIEEAPELAGAVLWVAAADYRACGDVQRRKQRGRAVTGVVVGAALDLAGTHRQQRLGAVERLDLGLLVHT